jgi:hypothetical protein
VEDTSGRPLSLVMDLRRNTRNQLDVRVSEGTRLFDGRHLWDLEVHTRPDETYAVRLKDLQKGDSAVDRDPGRDLPLSSASAPTVLSINRQEVWFSTSGGVVHCALMRPMCEGVDKAPSAPLDHPGPGPGFHVTLDEQHHLRLTLPLDPDTSGQVILTNVARVVGAHWVHEGFLQRDAVLDRMYRGRGSIVARSHAVVPDGALADWHDAEPLVVDSPWQIEEGANQWSGPRDASFSVTAARTGDAVCFAGRVRDDDIEATDTMELRVDHEVVRLGLAEAAQEGRVVVGRDWFGVRFEACLPVAAPSAGPLPFWASFRDVDGSDDTTVLSSAPVDDETVTGTIELPAPG